MTGAFVAFLRSFFVQATLATLDLGSNGMEVTWNISGYVICSVETGKQEVECESHSIGEISSVVCNGYRRITSTIV